MGEELLGSGQCPGSLPFEHTLERLPSLGVHVYEQEYWEACSLKTGASGTAICWDLVSIQADGVCEPPQSRGDSGEGGSPCTRLGASAHIQSLWLGFHRHNCLLAPQPAFICTSSGTRVLTARGGPWYLLPIRHSGPTSDLSPKHPWNTRATREFVKHKHGENVTFTEMLSGGNHLRHMLVILGKVKEAQLPEPWRLGGRGGVSRESGTTCLGKPLQWYDRRGWRPRAVLHPGPWAPAPWHWFVPESKKQPTPRETGCAATGG